jgi:dihydrofolate reductase
MSRLRLDITMSIDGFVAGPDQSVENPLGRGGERLHAWAYPLKTFREMHGDEGGETGVNDEVLRSQFEGVGAVIMGRNMFGGGQGPWGADPWTGWWGPNPPYHTAVFVLTHHAREPLAMEGGTTFHFVANGIDSALAQARSAAGDRDVLIGGGAKVAQQYLAAGLLDELTIHLVPLLLGAGARLFENLGNDVELTLVRSIEGPGVTHVTYRAAR